MLETEAIVVKIDDKVAYVETQRPSGCGHCDPQKGCATSTLTKFFGGKSTFFKALNPVKAQIGDAVIIGVEDGAVLKSALAVYFIPLIFVLSGAGLGNFLAASIALRDFYSIIGAGLGLAISFAWIKVYTRFAGSSRFFQPVVLRKVSAEKVVQFVKEI